MRAMNQTIGGNRALGPQVVAFAAVAVAMSAGSLLPRSSALDDCVAKRVAKGETRAVALAECLRETGGGTTEPPKLPTVTSGGSSDSGSSTGVVAAVGLGGLVVGALGATMLRKKGGGVAAPAASLPAMPSPTVPTAPVARAAAPDRSPGLIGALVDLADRVPSQALRAEVIATLARAGVQAVEPAAGDPFDAARMRGVGTAPAPDPSWIGRVAVTERAGFQDGAQVVRLPEVVVFTAAG